MLQQVWTLQYAALRRNPKGSKTSTIAVEYQRIVQTCPQFSNQGCLLTSFFTFLLKNVRSIQVRASLLR